MDKLESFCSELKISESKWQDKEDIGRLPMARLRGLSFRKNHLY